MMRKNTDYNEYDNSSDRLIKMENDELSEEKIEEGEIVG